MGKFYLLKTGEINLKGDNKFLFEKQLFSNIKRQLGSNIKVKIEGRAGRYFLELRNRSSQTIESTDEEKEAEKKIEETLPKVFGLIGYSIAKQTAKTMEAIEKAVLEEAEKAIAAASNAKEPNTNLTFKIEPRRTDKSFPLRSYDLACHLGGLVLDKFPALKVAVKKPTFKINVEIRDAAIIYSHVFPGRGGLPCGAAGRGILLLSGGIDSPVAGYLMAKRGATLVAVHFHTYPYTSEESRHKVIQIAEKLAEYLPSLRLHIVPFTDAQVFIKQNCKPDFVTLFSRAAMMRISHMIAERINGNSILTGECLSQVASQTAENIRFTGSETTLPIFRPLIGFDKEEIIEVAKNIGTYDISILPHVDCCSVFASAHPILKAPFEKTITDYKELEEKGLASLLQTAFENIEKLAIKN